MSLSLVKVKRKISCVPCRKKKVLCDGNQPCQRCTNRKTTDDCIYVKPGQAGRPPKNAVINKLVLNRSNYSNSNNMNSNSLRTQFIFETVGYVKPTNSVFINDDSSKNLLYFINVFFNNDDAVMQIAVDKVTRAIPYLPDIRITNLLEIYSGATIEILNVVLFRFSTVSLDNFNFFDAIVAAVFQDLALKYFSEPSLYRPVGNPLTTLPSEHAVQLIHTFFSVSPHAIFLNKTLLLQGYWTDSMEPLLLCVVYGTTIYLSRMLEGRPLGLWEAVDDENRNVFLDYAYSQVQKSSSEVSFAKYQAVILLGLFEVVFGHVKRALSILGLGFLIGMNLGVSDGIFQAKTDDIQAELANVTFWSLFASATRGSVELGQAFHCTKSHLSVGLPPATIEQSKSYEFEQTNGDNRQYNSYNFLVESFYTHVVFCRFTIMIILELPEPRYNMFAPRSTRKRISPRVTGHPKPNDLVPRLRKIFQEFDDFIRDTKHTWTKQQTYTLEMVCALLKIHVVFLKNIGPVSNGLNYGNSAYDFLQDTPLVPDDPMTMARIQEALPKIYFMMDKTEQFLSDPSNYNHKWNLLPRGLIISVLETAMEILLIKCAYDPWDELTFNYLKLTNSFTQLDIWKDWSAIYAVQARLKKFFEGYGSPSSSATEDNDLLTAATFGLSLSDSMDNGALAEEIYHTNMAFFDPCATWLNPMRNSTMDLRLLEGMANVSADTMAVHDTSIINRSHINYNTTGDSTDQGFKYNEGYQRHNMTNNQVLLSSEYYMMYPETEPPMQQSEGTPESDIPTTTPPIIQQILFDEDPFV